MSSKTYYAISAGKGQYLAALRITVTAKSGGKASATLSDGLNDRRNVAVMYEERPLAERLLSLCANGAPDATRGFKVVPVIYDGVTVSEATP
jgi:hypothetical protein